MNLICEVCGKLVKKRLSNTVNNRTGRAYKHVFCEFSCYNRWRSRQHDEVKKKWIKFQREVWGTTELARHQAGKAREVGRRGEILAINKHLPVSHFTEIDDWSNYSNQFIIDFVATFENQRVLVDCTIKLRTSIPEKCRLAKSLGMRLFIIHVSPLGELFWINEILNKTSCRVPATFIREHHKLLPIAVPQMLQKKEV